MHPYARLDMRGLERLGRDLEDSFYSPEAVRQFAIEYPKELAKVRRQARLRPILVNGNRLFGLKAGYFETTLRDGTLGYFQRRTDDCVQAAIATLLQMSPHEVPDLHFDKQVREGREPEEIKQAVEQRFEEWTAKHGLTIMVHTTPPRSAKRWIGIVTTGVLFNDHCLVMSGPDCLWDTTHPLPPSKDEPIAATPTFTVADIDYGITIERR